MLLSSWQGFMFLINIKGLKLRSVNLVINIKNFSGKYENI